MTEIQVRAMRENDWQDVARIYAEGIHTGNATFETRVPEWEEWSAAHLEKCRLIAEADGKVAGWAALSSVSSRCVYAGVAEESIYISQNFQGMGVGKQLLRELIVQSEKAGIWTMEAGIFPENTASIRLHESLGFRLVGTHEKIGKMNGIWRDTLLFERRSSILL
jgi:phosphinothricin acetyltransferase